MNRFKVLLFVVVWLFPLFGEAQARYAAGYNAYGEIHFYWEKTDGNWAHFHNPETYFRVSDSSVLFYSPIEGFKKLENVPELPLTDMFFAEKGKDVFYFESKKQDLNPGFSNGGKAIAMGTLTFANLNINTPLEVRKVNNYRFEINHQGDIQKRTMIWSKPVQAQFTGKYRLEVRNIIPPKMK